MSRRPDRARSPLQRLRPTGTDEGFSLIEVMVAMTIFAVISLASLSFLMNALSATSLARLESVAKNLSQERLESMRNVPYSVSNAVAGSALDLLDRYYPRTATSSTATSAHTSGFVVASDLARRDVSLGDPATGDFYRTVVAKGSIDGFPGFSQRIAAQFLANNGSVLSGAVFNSASSGVDALAPAATIGVTVTTQWETGGKAKRSSVYSQITNGMPRPPIVTLQARMAALRFSGILPNDREIVAETGVLSLDGSITSSTTASASASAGFASIADGARVDGAGAKAAAPPSQTAKSASTGTQTLPDGTVTVARLSNSNVSGVSATTTNGQPGTGTAAAPVTATMYGGGFGTLVMSAGNAPSTTSRLRLAGHSVVRHDAASCGGSCAAVQTQGHLASQGGPSHVARSALSSQLAGTVQLLATDFAPQGLIQLTLPSLGLTCESRAGATAAATLTYAATARWMTYDPATATQSYSQPVTLGHGNQDDPLGEVDLATTQVGVDLTGAPLYLSDYLQQWSSLTSESITDSTQVTTEGRTVSTSVPGVVSVTTTALRDEASSTAGLQLGSASCVAGNLR